MDLIVRRSAHPPTPWSWEIIDSSWTQLQRSRKSFASEDLAREDGQKALAERVAAAQPK